MIVHPRLKKALLPPPAKRRKLQSAIEEIKFDFDARADYLTGFHRRKVQRMKQAQEEAAKKAKEERIATRKLLRNERRQELEAHVESVNALLHQAQASGLDSSEEVDDGGWDGIQDDQSLEAIDNEAEYIDEDRFTTVTVEAVHISKEGLHKIPQEMEDVSKEARNSKSSSTTVKTESSRKEWPKKTRKKKFRYESKAERKITRSKQKAGNRIKADARRGKD